MNNDITSQAYAYVESMVPMRDNSHASAPMWYGWALREAFIAGSKANKPEAVQYSELKLDISIINEAADILYARLIEAPDIMREPIIDELHGIALGLPEKFAALQKRIEELEALVSTLAGQGLEHMRYGIAALGRHYSDEEVAALKDLINRTALTLKTGDVQAPKECTNSDTWNCKYCDKTKKCEALKDPRNFGEPIAAAPTDTEGK